MLKDKKTLILIGLVGIASVVLLLMILFPTLKEMGNRSNLGNNSEELNLQELNRNILAILTNEKGIDDYLSAEVQYMEKMESIFSANIDLLEAMERGLERSGGLEEINEWIILKRDIYESSRLLMTKTIELTALTDSIALAEDYENIIVLAQDIEKKERSAQKLLLGYEDDFRLPQNDNKTFSSFFNPIEDDKVLDTTVIPVEEKTVNNKPVVNKGYLLAKGHQDRLPLAIAICQHDNISVDELIFIRYMRSDDHYAFVIASPDYDPQIINQYVCEKINGRWKILKNYSSSVTMADVLKTDFPDYNVHLLPEYSMSEFAVNMLNDVNKSKLMEQLSNNGNVRIDEAINFISVINHHFFIITDKKTRIYGQISDTSMLLSGVTLSKESKYIEFHKLFDGVEDAPIMLFLQD